MSSRNATDTESALRPARSLAFRLTAWYAGSAFALVAIASGILYWALVVDLEREDDEELAEKVRVLKDLCRSEPDIPSVRTLMEHGWASRQFAQIFARIEDDQGATLLETPGFGAVLSRDMFPPAHRGEEVPKTGTDLRSPAGRVFRAMSVRSTPGVERSKSLTIQVAVDRTPEIELIARYRTTLWIVIATALVVCGLVGHQIARRGLQPLHDITATAARISVQHLNERITREKFPAELALLAASFNQMLARLQESFERLARFSADIAHELRTPVSNLRGEVEVALSAPRSPEEYREVLASSLEECQRLARLIDNLLFLARAEHPETRVEKETLSITRELTAIRDFYEPIASEMGIAVTLHASASTSACLNKALFQRAVGNLIDNALRYTPRGGTITLSARNDTDSVLVEVADTGAGIEERHVPRLFDRFYRADSARSSASGGVGLGLAIVRGIMELHGGTASIASAVGKGTRVSLQFPCAK